MDQSLERWRPVVGYEGLYEVSDQGRVRSLARVYVRRNGSPCRNRSLVLRQSLTGRDRTYYKVGLTKAGSSKTHRVSVLVATAFLGPRPAGTVVAHGPNGSLDNSLDNLSYKTYAQNSNEDRLRDGTLLRGTDHPQSKLTEQQVLFARTLCRRRRGLLTTLAKAWGVGVPTLYDAVVGTNWSWL